MPFKMDPWTCQSSVTSETIVLSKFEDNFIDKLPDSDEYIAILEEKLRKIKNDPSLLQQLATKKEACMRQLLNSEVNYDIDTLFLDEPVPTSQMLRTILPQKQALNQSELVEIVKYDQLKDNLSEPDITNTPPAKTK